MKIAPYFGLLDPNMGGFVFYSEIIGDLFRVIFSGISYADSVFLTGFGGLLDAENAEKEKGCTGSFLAYLLSYLSLFSSENIGIFCILSMLGV